MLSRCAICCGMVPSLSFMAHPGSGVLWLGTPRKAYRSEIMASRVRPSTRELARHITRVVYESSDGQPHRWRMLSTIPGAPGASVLYAKEQGWIELEGGRRACLTEEGRRLIAKEAH